MNFYRMRSRIVKNAPHRTFYVQRRVERGDGRDSWVTVARSSSRADAVAFTALPELGLADEIANEKYTPSPSSVPSGHGEAP